MSNEHLDKAKAALAAASDMDVDLSAVRLPLTYSRLLDLAQVQAAVALAEAACERNRREASRDAARGIDDHPPL